MRPPSLRQLSQLAVVGIFALGLLFALHLTAAIVVPMTAAIVVGTVLGHVFERAQRIGVPPLLSAAVLVVAVGVGIFYAAGALASRLSSIADRAPQLVDRLSRDFAPLLHRFEIIKQQWFGGAAAAHAGAAAPAFDMGWVSTFVAGVTPALGGMMIFLATLFFFVAGRAQVRRVIVLAPPGRKRRLAALRILNATEDALAHYFGSAAIVYATLSAVTAGAAWIGGLGSPFLWGLLTFVASFAPFVGPTIVFLALAAAGIMSDQGLLMAGFPAAVFLVAHLASENAVLPAIIGRRFEINPFLVFVSIVFWTWMWGAVGAVLASPLLLIFSTIVGELTAPSRPALPE